MSVALAVASLILALLNDRTLGEIFMTSGPSTVTLATLIVSFSVVGALIASHRPENPIGWIFLAEGFLYGLLSAGEEYAIYAFLTNPGSLPLGAEFSWLVKWIWAPGLGLLLVFLPLLFPDGHLLSRRWRWVAWLGGLSIGLICVLTSIVLWPERGPALVRPGGFAAEVEEWRSAELGWLWSLVGPMMFVGGLGAVISLLIRYRRARGDERQQIKWFASAVTLTLVWIIVFGQSAKSGLPGVLVALSASLVIPSIPIATGIAILRYRLTAMLALVYFGGVTATQAVLPQAVLQTLTGQEKLPQLAIVVSTLAIAALFTPLRRRLQSFIDRRFYRRKYDARKTLEAFSSKLKNETDLEALNNDLVGVVGETMQPAHVSVWLRVDTVPKGAQAD
jgi:hypothetical protein